MEINREELKKLIIEILKEIKEEEWKPYLEILGLWKGE